MLTGGEHEKKHQSGTPRQEANCRGQGKSQLHVLMDFLFPCADVTPALHYAIILLIPGEVGMASVSGVLRECDSGCRIANCVFALA